MCDIQNLKFLGGVYPLNCLEIVVTCSTIRKNPGCATDSWPGHFSNPNKIDSKNASPY